ncbi:MAG: hypothetical protein L6R48_02920 [Planctomycetes bacterium]|nr:hypothetical protein [Planctomycetota bacterium]
MIRALLLAVLLVVAGQAAEKPAAAERIAVRILTGDPIQWVKPGAGDDLALEFANPLERPVAIACTGTLGEFDGTSRPVAWSGTLPARGEVRVPLGTGSARLGIRQLDYTLSAEGAGVRGRCSFLVAEPAGASADPSGFLFGVASHPERHPVAERELEMLAASRAGAKVMRIDAHWRLIEPQPGVRNWSVLDNLTSLAAAQGMELQVILAYGTPHAGMPTPAQEQRIKELLEKGRVEEARWLQMRLPPEDAAWRRFVQDTVEHCRGRVRLWEVWNEPDLSGFFLGSTDDYLRMLRSAYAVIKQADPTALVLSGGFSGVGKSGNASKDLHERVLAEASDSFDAHAFHGHGPFSYFQPTLDGELKRMRAAMTTPRPLYCNETALTSTRYGERAQALALVKKLAFARARGAIGYTWYDLRNDGRDPDDEEHNYGMVTRDFQPKPVYAVYNELVRRMRGLRFAGELDLGRGRYGLVFAGGGRRLVVHWVEDGALALVPLLIRAPGCSAARAVDLMGNPSPRPVHDQVVLLHPTAEPAYLELEGGEALPTVCGPILAMEDALAVPGESAAISIHVRNPLATPVAVKLSWDASCRGAPARVELAAGEDRDLAVQALCPTWASAARPATMAVLYEVEGRGWAGSAEFAIRALQRIPSGARNARAPDFALADFAQVVNFFQADPSSQHLTWKGVDDLSAQVWLESGADALRLHVAVRDDRHRQAGPAEDAWRGDGIQIAFQPLGGDGYWELGAAQADDGSLLRSVWSRPAGCSGPVPAFGLRCTPLAGGLAYDLELGHADFGLTPAMLARGLRFNLIVNDDDAGQREGFIRIAPGIGERKNPLEFPIVAFPQPGSPP